MQYAQRIPRASALVGRVGNHWSLVCPIWRREALESARKDRIANDEAFPFEQLIRLPRRFSRPHAWPNLMGPGTRGTMPGALVLAHVERSLRFHCALPSYVPSTIGLPMECAS